MTTMARDVGSAAGSGAVVLFDGVCHLCQRAIRFIIARDRRGWFRFAALQSPIGRDLLARAGVGHDGTTPDSIVLIESGRAHLRSSAALRIARRLRFPWPLLFVLILVPSVLRDPLYDAIARRRYRWFGRDDTCPMPTPDLAARFLHESRPIRSAGTAG